MRTVGKKRKFKKLPFEDSLPISTFHLQEYQVVMLGC